MTVFLDVDGVLADWAGGVHKHLGIDYDYTQWPYKTGPPGWDWHLEVGKSFQEISELCDTAFWSNLEWTHDGRDILRAILNKVEPEDVYLLTAPMPNMESATGKVMWVHKNLPEYSERLIITTAPKAIFAQVPNSVLIDDFSRNVREWRRAGGSAITIPRPWNWGYANTESAAEWMKGLL